jgi:soluble P-type ATPase
MSVFKKTLIVLIVLGAISIIYLSWYAAKHSMEEARAFEVNEPDKQYHVLVATQGSSFKDSVVTKVIVKLKDLPVHIKVIDVSRLPEIIESEWTALLILHTWENFAAQQDVEAFLHRATTKNKMVVVATSGSGDEMIEGIDGITSASKPEEVDATANEIVKRVLAILNVV